MDDANWVFVVMCAYTPSYSSINTGCISLHWQRKWQSEWDVYECTTHVSAIQYFALVHLNNAQHRSVIVKKADT